jgi:hypothetical protein
MYNIDVDGAEGSQVLKLKAITLPKCVKYRFLHHCLRILAPTNDSVLKWEPIFCGKIF